MPLASISPGIPKHRRALDDVMTWWKLRDLVRITASLVSDVGVIHEELGEHWAADVQERKIFWRPTSPLPPHDIIQEDDCVYLIGHEAAHIDFTGGYRVPVPLPVNVLSLFHSGFYNELEDIRIDRLQGKRFGGYERMKLKFNREVMTIQAGLHPEQWPLVMQVTFAWMALDDGLNPFGTQRAVDFAKATWAKVSRKCNAESSQLLVDVTWDIFLELIGAEEEDRDPDPDVVDDRGWDEPAKNPVRSPFVDEKKEPNRTRQANDSAVEALGKLMEALGAGAREAKQAIGKLVQGEAAERRLVEVKMQQYAAPGKGYSKQRSADDSWHKDIITYRESIDALARKIKATLSTNAADSYQDGYRRGKLNTHRAPMAVRGHNNIMRKRHAIGTIDYALALAVDASGSMSGTKMPNARMASVLLMEAFDKCGLATAMSIYDGRITATKGFNQSLPGMRGVLGANLVARGGTYEAGALMFLFDELKHCRAPAKLMFALSDGDTDGKEDSKKAIALIEETGTRVVAIGLNFTPASHYREKLSVRNASELAEVMPRYINDLMRKGR